MFLKTDRQTNGRTDGWMDRQSDEPRIDVNRNVESMQHTTSQNNEKNTITTTTKKDESFSKR